MDHEDDSSDYQEDLEQSQTSPKQKAIIHSLQGKRSNEKFEESTHSSGTPAKSSVPVRILRVLWRWRKSRQMAGNPGPNWAERTIVVLTLVIATVGAIQAWIYWKQAGIMQASLNQNERQLAIAAKNAKTAEDTLAEMREGGGDTNQLAVATGDQAAVAKGSLVLSTKSFHVSERPYVTIENFRFDPALEQGHDPATLKLGFHNAGRTPALKAELAIDTFVDERKTAQTPWNFPSEITIPSNNASEISMSVWVREPGHFEGIIKGNKKLSIKGTIRYTDIFKEWHTTAFCAVYDAKITKTWVYCPGNDVR